MPALRLPLALTVAAALVAAAPAAASAAPTIKPLNKCVVDSAKPYSNVEVSGFPANAPLVFSVDGTQVAQASAGADGSISGSIAIPKLASSIVESTHTVQVTDGTNVASAKVSSTKIRGEISPNVGNPETLKVSFSAYGMNLAKPNQRVYVHYVAPGGHYKKTISIGKATGPCGHILKTKKRKLFNFKAAHGKWILQYDTSRTYHKPTKSPKYPIALYSVKIKFL
jgi:hypothetical protein